MRLHQNFISQRVTKLAHCGRFGCGSVRFVRWLMARFGTAWHCRAQVWRSSTHFACSSFGLTSTDRRDRTSILLHGPRASRPARHSRHLAQKGSISALMSSCCDCAACRTRMKAHTEEMTRRLRNFHEASPQICAQ